MSDIVLNGITYPAERKVAFPGADGQEVVFELPTEPEAGLNSTSKRPPQTKVVYSAVKSIEEQLTSPFNFKGTVADLTALAAISNPAQNDTYYVTAEKCRYSWNGSAWAQSSMDEGDYEDELSALKNDITSINNEVLYENYTNKGSLFTIYKCEGIDETGKAIVLPYACRSVMLLTSGPRLCVSVSDSYMFSIVWFSQSTQAINGTVLVSRVPGGTPFFVNVPDEAKAVVVVFYTSDHDTSHVMTDSDVEAISNSFIFAYENKKILTHIVSAKFEHLSLTSEGKNADNGITTNLFYTRFRQQKFLHVVPMSTVSIDLETGETAILWEYDKEMNMLKSTTGVTDGQGIALTSNTNYIKFTFAPASEQRYAVNVFKTISVLSREKPKLVFNKKLTESQRCIFAVPYPLPQDIAEGEDSTYSPSTHEVGYSAGILMLPDTYTPDGAPTRLIIFCHSSGYYFSFTQGQFDMHMAMYRYLVAEGYAVFDTWGHSSFATPSAYPRVYGNPDNMACYASGYQWVIDNYNICTDGVFVSGKSLGGCPAMNIVFGRCGIPVKACGLMAPGLNHVRKAFGYTEGDRFENAWAFGLTDYTDALGGSGIIASILRRESYQTLMDEQYEKFCDWVPFWSNTVGVINNKSDFLASAYLGVEGVDVSTGDGDTERWKNYSKYCTVPVKLWCAVDDDSVPYRANYNFVHMLKNGGSVAELRTLKSNTGSHHAMDFDEENSEKLSSVVTALGYTIENVPVAYYELIEFFRRYS